MNHKQEIWGKDIARQVSAQCNLSATTATISHIFSDSVRGHRESVQEDLNLALAVLRIGDTKSRLRHRFFKIPTVQCNRLHCMKN